VKSGGKMDGGGDVTGARLRFAAGMDGSGLDFHLG
jgi:hypothetical protein